MGELHRKTKAELIELIGNLEGIIDVSNDMLEKQSNTVKKIKMEYENIRSYCEHLVKKYVEPKAKKSEDMLSDILHDVAKEVLDYDGLPIIEISAFEANMMNEQAEYEKFMRIMKEGMGK